MMKKFVLFCAALGGLCAATCASAQSAVTLYGILDESLQYTHHEDGGRSQLKLQSGQMSITQWGIKGTEALGDGLSAVFNLQNGFNLNSGAMTGGLMFGRRAYVGLSQPVWGTVTLGRQIDVLQDLVVPVQGDNYLEYFTAPGDVDLADGSVQFSNVVKWLSPVWSGLQVGAMYALGGVAGATGSGASYALAANYGHGPLTLAAGYLHVDNGNALTSARGTTTAGDLFFSPVNAAYASASAYNIVRAGASYSVGAFVFGGYYSYSEYLADASSTFTSNEHYNNGSVYAVWHATPAATVEIGYDYMKSHGDSSATYHQATIAADYALSKRTDLYTSASYGRASGHNGSGVAQAVIADAYADGGTNNQEIVMVGMRHRF